MNVISLFSGCGGLDLGFIRAGFNVVWSNEFDQTIHSTYRMNFPYSTLIEENIIDINSNNIPDCDGIIGGPPCQAWSEGGKGLGLKDNRGKVFLQYLRIIRDKKPRFFLIENVRGLLSVTHINVFNKIIQNLSSYGYSVKYALLNAKDFQIPQDRIRLFIVGFRNDRDNLFQFPQPINKPFITLKQAIGDITIEPRGFISTVVKNELSGSLSNHDYYTGVFDEKYMSRNRVRGWDEASFTIQALAKNIPIHPQAPKMQYVSQNKRIFKTGFESLYRRLSIRECARIQTFSDKFIFNYSDIKDGYKMIGNAVPPRLAYHLAKQIYTYYKQII